MAASSYSNYSKQNTAKPRKIWWLIGVVVLAVCILVQMPAVWIVNKIAPDSPYIQQVSGNLWQGSAIVQLPLSMNSMNSSSISPSGSLTWQWRPLSLFLGKMSADIQIESGQSELSGQLSKGFNSWQMSDVSGRLDKQTLSSFVDWQLPDAPIQVNALNLSYADDAGFDKVDGQLTWVGGELGYPSGGKVFQIILPAMQADLSQEKKDNQQVIYVNLVDNNSRRLRDLYLDPEGMLDVSLTQRLLENMPEYQGSAPADTDVVSVRQPLFGGSQ